MERRLGPLAGSVHDWWRGPASNAYLVDWQRFSGGFAQVDGSLHRTAGQLREAADHIETAQHTYDCIAGGVALTTAAGIGLTLLTLGASDAVAGEADAAEIGAATTAIEVLTSALSGVTGLLQDVLAELEATLLRVQLGLSALPPFVIEAGGGAALGAAGAYAFGERDTKALAMWAAVGAATGVAGDGADDPPARGGLGPVLQGQAGVERSIAAAEARGETVIGREITVDTSAGRTRLDLLVQNPDGTLKFIESKNGPTAGLTPNQSAAFPKLQTQGGTPQGQNAANAGLQPGVAIGPTQVQIDWWSP